MLRTNDEWLFIWTLNSSYEYYLNTVANTSPFRCTTMYQSLVLMCLVMGCTGYSAKEAPITSTTFLCYSATVRLDFADDTPFFLARFTFIGSGVLVRRICSSTTYAGNDESNWGAASVGQVAIGGVGGFKEGGGDGTAPSGISPFLSTTKGSEGVADAESRNRLG